MRQFPRESFFAFICSQNSNVPRITSCVLCLKKEFGTHVGDIEGKEYYSFPTFSKLAQTPPEKLKDLGFGYRARYIPAAAQQVILQAEAEEDLPTFEGKKI